MPLAGLLHLLATFYRRMGQGHFWTRNGHRMRDSETIYIQAPPGEAV